MALTCGAACRSCLLVHHWQVSTRTKFQTPERVVFLVWTQHQSALASGMSSLLTVSFLLLLTCGDAVSVIVVIGPDSGVLWMKKWLSCCTNSVFHSTLCKCDWDLNRLIAVIEKCEMYESILWFLWLIVRPCFFSLHVLWNYLLLVILFRMFLCHYVVELYSGNCCPSL